MYVIFNSYILEFLCLWGFWSVGLSLPCWFYGGGSNSVIAREAFGGLYRRLMTRDCGGIKRAGLGVGGIVSCLGFVRLGGYALLVLAMGLVFGTALGAVAAGREAVQSPLAVTGPSIGYDVDASVAGSGMPEVVYPAGYADLVYRPLAKVEYEGNPRVDAKGVYATLYSVSGARLDELIRLADTTDINALVIDFKDDRGDLLMPTAAVRRYHPGAKEPVMKDVAPLIKRLKEHGIYPIARIVTFKDPSYTRAHPSKAIMDPATGKPYESRDGLTWASPYDSDFRAYNLALAREAAAAGFREIQFDYIRFPDVSISRKLDYRNPTGISKAQSIQDFLLEARGQLAPLRVYLAADIFGLVPTVRDDMNIGQYWEAVSNAADYLCPMMYPSHYGPGVYGFPVPDKEPHGVLARGLDDSLKRNRNLVTPAELRPWLQAFTASWLKEYRTYGITEVKEQIRACRERGIESYLIWNPGNRYTPGAYR
ncbi:MAG: hypothetical protein RI897_4350 [Verrucomicrobiota bacterium]